MCNFNNIFLTFVLTAFLSTVTLADEVFEFKNPSFSGQGYSNHVLSIEQLQFTRKNELKEKMESEERRKQREAESTTLAKFLSNVESRIYAQLSKQMVDNMFSDTGALTGTAEIEGATIFWERDTDLGTISIRITEADGTVTTLTVPVGDFGF